MELVFIGLGAFILICFCYISEYGEKTKTKIEEFKAGTLKVFDTANFKVDGAALAADYKADVDTDEKFEKDTVVVENGIFLESDKRSAPYFDVRIDGITLLNEKY